MKESRHGDAPFDSRLVFTKGEFVLLKVLGEDDLNESDWIGWFNDAEHCQYTQHHYYPATFESQRRILEGCISPTTIQLGVIDREAPESIIGVISLKNISYLHGNCEIGASLSQERTRGKPQLFLEAWSLMLRHGFEELGLRKIYGGALSKRNADMLKRMFNFEIEGLQKEQVFKSGKHRDVTLVGVFRDTVKYFDPKA